MQEQITTTDLAKAVKELRDLQRRFFKTRDYSLIDQCKQMEKKVDAMVESVLAPPTLFD